MDKERVQLVLKNRGEIDQKRMAHILDMPSGYVQRLVHEFWAEDRVKYTDVDTVQWIG